MARRPNKGKPIIEMTARWWMPYEKSALFKIQNVGKESVAVGQLTKTLLRSPA